VGFDALTNLLLTLIPNFEFLIITNTSEFINVKLIPCHIFDNLAMSIPLY